MKKNVLYGAFPKRKPIPFVTCQKSGMGFKKNNKYPIIDDNNGLHILNTKHGCVICHCYGENLLVVIDDYGKEIEPTIENVYFKF